LQVLVLIIVVPPFLNYASIQREIKELKPENGKFIFYFKFCDKMH